MTRAKRRLAPQEKIVRAARRLLLEEGHERLSLRAVARRVGFAPSSLYEHFQSRQTLLETLALSALDDLRKEVAAACAQGATIGDRLTRAAMAYLAFATARPSEFRLCFSRPRPADMAEPLPSSPLLPVVVEIHRALSAGECALPAGLSALDMAIAIWTQAHGMAALRVAYLANASDFDDKARQILASTIDAWLSTA